MSVLLGFMTKKVRRGDWLGFHDKKKLGGEVNGFKLKPTFELT